MSEKKKGKEKKSKEQKDDISNEEPNIKDDIFDFGDYEGDDIGDGPSLNKFPIKEEDYDDDIPEASPSVTKISLDENEEKQSSIDEYLKELEEEEDLFKEIDPPKINITKNEKPKESAEENNTSAIPPIITNTNNKNEEEQLEIEDSNPSSSQNKKLNYVASGLIALIVAIFSYYAFFNDDEKPDPSIALNESSQINKKLPVIEPPKLNNTQITTAQIPELPKPPEVNSVNNSLNQSPTPPVVNISEKDQLTKELAPPPAVVGITSKNTPTPSLMPEISRDNDDMEQKRMAKLRSNISLKMGSGTSSGLVEAGGRQTSSMPTYSGQISPYTIGDISLVIAEGKIIDAVLESAINTDLPGPLRAIISQDVYGESGKNILIPVGSRLIGTYNASVAFGQDRVMIAWNRLIRPDGITFDINSPGVDSLGRAGSKGKAYNKYLETLTNSLLVSAVNVALGAYTDKNSKKNNNASSQTNNQNGSTTTTFQPSNQDNATKQAIEDIAEINKNFIQQSLDAKPTIIVEQGTRIKVFVQQDMVFPAGYLNNSGSIK